MIRSCYSCNMLLYRDADELTPVLWYFVPDDRPTIPYAHPFVSRVWDITNDEPEPDLGERYTPRPWNGGAAPSKVKGTKFCGTEFQWENGPSFFDPIPTLWPGTGVPTCCDKPALLDVGGIAVGGEDEVTVLYEGGLSVGGRDFTYAYDNDRGGFDVGGQALVALVAFDLGGATLGGQAIVSGIEQDLGGLVVGGEDLVAPPTADLGGLVVGGEDVVALHLAADVGGLVVGGEDLVAAPTSDLGGLVVGGEDAVKAAIVTDRKGVAVGGSDTVIQTKIYLSGCAATTVRTWKMIVTNTGCTCLPTQINFNYNYVNQRWESITNTGTCTGTNCSDWYFTYSAVGNKFLLWDSSAFQNAFVSCGPPPQASVLVSVNNGYCGSGFHNWGGNMFER